MARALILRTAGTNCDEETARAFELAGATTERLHVAALIRRERRLGEFDILVFPGGFSYGDDLGAGTVLAARLRSRLADDVAEFVASGRLVLGICNGFQVLVRLGILPGGGGPKIASLVENTSGRFEDRWVRLRVASPRSPFLSFARSAPSPTIVRCPVAHREGRFFVPEREIVEELRAQGQIALTYAAPSGSEDAAPEDARGAYPANPNGSIADIAGITNLAGNVLGLMPHPERFVHALQDPLWTRRLSRIEPPSASILERAGDGFPFFASALSHARARELAG
jgi:phosphoribosylformylglycinamidine synthase I